MTWLLDTNVLIHAARGRPAPVRKRLKAVSPSDLTVSSVSVAELWYGAWKSTDPERKRKAWEEFLLPYAIIPFDREAAERHAEIRFALRHHPIGDRDLLIASIALANKLTLATHNLAEFSRVPGLRCEDWTLASSS